jgi:translation elongation factor P/translation initiation factor 5A
MHYGERVRSVTRNFRSGSIAAETFGAGSQLTSGMVRKLTCSMLSDARRMLVILSD